MTGFLERLAEKLFSNAGAEAVRKTRQLIIWSVVIVSIIVVIRLLRRSNISGLTRATPKSTVFSFNDITEDLHSINYNERIAEAISKNDYRLAIRWHYLELLFQLDKKQLIQFAPYKTNIDYRYELKDKGTQRGFYEASRIYDYVWYGQFSLNETDYAHNAQTFISLKKELHV